MRLIDADALMKALKISDDCEHCEQCEYDYFCSMGGDFVSACEAIHEAPNIDVPTKPIADVIGYRWKLKWVLEEAPDIIDALMERSRR